MKRSLRFTLSLILCLALCLSMVLSAFATEGTKITNVNEAFNLTRSADGAYIYKAALSVDGKAEKPIYYVTCRGLDITEFNPDKPRSYQNAIKMALSNENNSYVKTVKSLVAKYIPSGSTVVFTGNSMGGMVVQQVIANKEIKDAYEIPYTLSIASPYILTKNKKEGTLTRMADRLDPVPYFSIPLLANPYMGNVHMETSHQPPLVHINSYSKGKCWNKYDCLGQKYGSSYIVVYEKLN